MALMYSDGDGIHNLETEDDRVKLVELLKDGADPNTTNEVREESELGVRSWWWRERERRSRPPAFR